MKKIILVTALFLTATIAQADIAAPPAPTGATQATKPSKEERKAMKEQRKAMKEQHQAESAEMREQVKAACAADIATTGCNSELGQGLMKCIHAYKEANKDFKVSDSCKAAAKDAHHMHHERREERKAMRGGKKGGAEPQPMPAAPATN